MQAGACGAAASSTGTSLPAFGEGRVGSLLLVDAGALATERAPPPPPEDAEDGEGEYLPAGHSTLAMFASLTTFAQ